MPEIGAFFDFDGTLIDGYSAAPYFIERLRRREMSRGEAADIIRTAWRGDMNESEFADVVGRGITAWAGRPEARTHRAVVAPVQGKDRQPAFPRGLEPREGAPENGAHGRDRHLGHALPGRPDRRGTRYRPCAVHARDGAGRPPDRRCRGHAAVGNRQGPSRARFRKRARDRASESHGYANGNEDIAFLKTVGHATAVNPKPALIAAAQREGWAVLRFPQAPQHGRDARPQPRRLSHAGGDVARRRRLCRDDGREAPRRRMGQRAGQRRHAGDDRRRRRGRRASTICGRIGLRCSCSIIRAWPTATSCCGCCGAASPASPSRKWRTCRSSGRSCSALDFAFIDRSATRSAIEAMAPAVDRLRAA